MKIKNLKDSEYFERIAGPGTVLYYRPKPGFTITHFGIKVHSIEFRNIGSDPIEDASQFWVVTEDGHHEYNNTDTVTLNAYQTIDRGMI